MKPIYVRVEKASQKETWTLLQSIADKMAPRMRKQYLDALKQVRSQVSVKELADAFRTGQYTIVERALKLDQTLPVAVKRSISDGVRSVFGDAGQVSVGLLPKAIQPLMRFDMMHPRTVDFLRSYELNLIENITKQTKEGVRQVIIDAFEKGRHPYESAEELKSIIGLNQKQATALRNYREMLIEEGHRGSGLKKLVSRYEDTLLDTRTKTIARTETMRAANAGYSELWQQAAAEGLIDPNKARRVWILTPDDKLCDHCRAVRNLNPKGVRMDEEFKTLDGSVHAPPLHPNCRCVTVIAFND